MARLSMQNQILNDMIVRAKRRAKRLCPTGYPTHDTWVRVDTLVSDQKGKTTTSMYGMMSSAGFAPKANAKRMPLDLSRYHEKTENPKTIEQLPWREPNQCIPY